MTGLFSRLAQQHINRSQSRIKPATVPVFPMFLGHEAVRQDNGLSSPQPAVVGSQQPVKQSQATDRADMPNAPLRSKPKTTEQHENTVVSNAINTQTYVTQQVKAVDSSSAHRPSHGPAAEAEQPTAIASNRDLSQSPPIQAQSENQAVQHPDRTQAATVNHLPATQATVPPPVTPQTTKQQRQNNKEISQLQATSATQTESQTTVNISIGQIEIKATQPVTAASKAPTQAATQVKPERSSALEAYHQSRLRGER